jgi:CRP/FNR family cyclic AMP-dependent transcriptional regulator
MSLPTEDALTYLPRKPLQEFAKGRAIYSAERPNSHLWVVILGRVKITTTSDDGCQTIGRILGAEGLFGESCLVGAPARLEAASAIDDVTLMSWSSAEVQLQIEHEPRLGIALSQYLVRQCLEMQDRIESMAIYKTPERVMLALLQLSAELGTPLTGGLVRVASLTHHTLAEYVGTSREIVTFQLNRLRRAELIHYTRQYLDIDTTAVTEALRRKGVHIPAAHIPVVHTESAQRVAGATAQS